MVHKTRAEAKANLDSSIAYIPERYKAGVQKADWHTPAASDAAEKNYADATTKAIANKRRQKGVAAVTNEEWRNGAVNKGANIIGERIRGALAKYDSKFGPMLDAVNATADALPPKTVDYMANISNRLVPVVKKFKEMSGKA